MLNEVPHRECRNGGIDPRILYLGTRYMCCQFHAPIALNFAKKKSSWYPLDRIVELTSESFWSHWSVEVEDLLPLPGVEHVNGMT
jgi:hypothetical protein